MSGSSASATLVPLTVTHAASGASLQVYLFGAQVTSYIYSGQEALYLSSAAVLDGSQPIRGGIPLAFPQFAAQGPLPMHGFARTSLWNLERQGDGLVELSLRDSPATLALWPHAFHLLFTATFDGPRLTTALRVSNPQAAPSAFAFEALQHTYLATGPGSVSEEGQGGSLTIAGLQGLACFAKPTGQLGVEDRQAFTPLGELDNIYSGEGGQSVAVGGIAGPAFHSVRVTRSGLAVDPSGAATAHALDVVVWNPGPSKAASIADLGPGEWRTYVCVEPGRVAKATQELGNLAPGAAFVLTQELLLQA